MMYETQKLVYDRNYDDFTLRYYLTERKPAADRGAPCYGVLLTKTRKDSTEPEREAALLSECKEKTLRALQILHKMEVTPMSFYEVIDTVAERCLYDDSA